MSDPIHRPRARSRSRSPKRSEGANHHKRRRHNLSPSRSTNPTSLPLDARPLTKHDLAAYRPIFALYLDIQKQKDIDTLDETEVKGRWKSFVGKWNRGELARGWYDPITLQKANAAAAEDERATLTGNGTTVGADDALTARQRPSKRLDKSDAADDDADSEDDYGPAPPTASANISTSTTTPSGITNKHGPSIPNINDLAALRSDAEDSAAAAHQASVASMRAARKEERRLQTSRLDDLAPRPEAGTRERLLEKRREAAYSNSTFAASAHDSSAVDVPDSDLMGDQDSLSALKRMKAQNERKKNERELRREENLRARRAEFEERMRGRREKEEKTLEGLRELARARFG